MGTWRAMFAVAAVFNFAVGLPFLLQPEIIFSAVGQPVPTDVMFVRLAGALIATFGLGYAMVSYDPYANRPIVWLGVIGKFPMPVILWFYLQAGLIPVSSFAVTLGDAVFVVLFGLFLLTTTREKAAA